MNRPPVASVVIPVWNGAATIDELLVALKGQASLPGPSEIIVVDNGSTDRTAEIVRARGVTLCHQPVRGPSAARNLGLAQAQSPIVVFVDADTLPSRRWLASLLAAFESSETVLATGPIHGWQAVTAAERFAGARNVFSREKTADHPRHPFVHGMHCAVRRSAALAVGGWDENLTSGEDVDFCLRLRKCFAAPIRFVDAAVLFHKHRSTDDALWQQARWHGAGYALVHQRHPELRWTVWRTLAVRFTLALLRASAPFVTLGRITRLLSASRAEFEHYQRHWTRDFWAGFFEQWKRRQP